MITPLLFFKLTNERMCKEELGFDIAWTGDHFVDWSRPNAPWFELWALLAAIAVKTTRIRLESYVTQIPFRNPALLARQALAVDQICAR